MLDLRLAGLILAFASLGFCNLSTNCLDKSPMSPSALYRIALDHYGPQPSNNPTISMPHVMTPVQHEPLKVLPHPPIPPPKLVSHRIVHYKTYVRPQVYQRIITVPKIYRFLKNGVHPVIEHIPYQAKPLIPDIEPNPQILTSNSLQPQTPLNPTKVCFPPQLSKTPSNTIFPQFVC